IGFDLHDDLGQRLMGASLLLKALETNLSHQGLPQAAQARETQKLLAEIINHTHNLAHGVSSLDVNGEDLPTLIRKLAANAKKNFQIKCKVQISSPAPILSPEVTLQLYKMAQESVTNAIKHGKATEVLLSVAEQGGKLILRIQNDGTPFPVKREANNRMGLRI